MRPDGFFVGRQRELARVRDGLAVEPVVVVYGVAGIGKSELAHHALADADDEPAPVLVLRVTGAQPPPPWIMLAARLPHPIPSAIAGVPDAALDWVVGELVRSPHRILVDDAHLAPEAVAALVDAVVRRGGASRVIVTSQQELPLRTSPTVVRLGPLLPEEALTLARTLSERLERRGLPLADIVQAAAGSPFALRELVASWRPGVALAPGSLHATIAALPGDERTALARLAAVAACPLISQPLRGLVTDEALAGLQRRLLVDVMVGRLVVHDMVRDAVNATLSSDERGVTARAVAAAARAQFAATQRPDAAVEALCLTVAAGELDVAARELPAIYPVAAAGGLDHLLLGAVERLAGAGHSRAALTQARILVRMAHIARAEAVLARLADDAEVRTTPSFHTLRGFVAQRRGNLRDARTHLETALRQARRAAPRWRITLHLVDVLSLSGDHAEADRLLAECRGPELAPGQLARLRWSEALADVLAQDFDEALARLDEGRRHAARVSRDLQLLLGLLEILAACEAGQLERARRVVAELATDWGAQGLRVQVVEFYLGVLAFTEGDLRAAIAHLGRAHEATLGQQDLVFACLSGHYLGRAHLAQGDVAAAIRLFRATTADAERAGFAPLVPAGQVMLARALLSAGQRGEAAALAGALVEHPAHHARRGARQVLALAEAMGGDLEAGRRRIALALADTDARPARRSEVLLDQADIETLGGDPEVALAVARTVHETERTAGRRYLELRAHLTKIAARLARGRSDDLAAARRDLDRLGALADQVGSAHARARLTVLTSALEARGGGRPDPGALSGLVGLGPSDTPGMVGYLHFIGLSGERRWFVAGAATRVGTAAELEREVERRDLVIDVVGGNILTRGGAIRGRTGLVTLLAHLAATRPVPVPADELYRVVWGGEYHALRNRNTLYVALNRARNALERLLPGREVIARAGDGWTLADDLDVCLVTTSPPLSDRQTL